jgi:hypothetical protein
MRTWQVGRSPSALPASVLTLLDTAAALPASACMHAVKMHHHTVNSFWICPGHSLVKQCMLLVLPKSLPMCIICFHTSTSTPAGNPTTHTSYCCPANAARSCTPLLHIPATPLRTRAAHAPLWFAAQTCLPSSSALRSWSERTCATA